MTRLLWSPQAVEDVEAIRSFVARDSEHYANLLVERIVAAVDRLGSFPLACFGSNDLLTWRGSSLVLAKPRPS